MVRYANEVGNCAPLFILTFRLIAPRKLAEAQKFNQQYHRYEDIEAIPDKLRWCRHQRGWMQAEVAEKIGVSGGMYRAIETGAYEYIPYDLVEKLASLYEIDPTDLIDDYGLFIYRGPGQAIRACRERLGLTVREFEERFGISRGMLGKWESERKRVSRKSWEKHFRSVGAEKNI